MYQHTLFSYTLIVLVSSFAIYAHGAATSRFLFPGLPESGISLIGALGEDLSELLTYSPENFLNEVFDEDDFPDPSQYNIDDMQQAEEGFLGGLFPFGLRNLVNDTNGNMARAACTANGKSGVCMLNTSCTGTPVAGFCSGPANIQCCIPGTTSAGGSSGGACGSYAGTPTTTIVGNGNKVYTVMKVKKEHLSNPNSYNMASDKSDNTITPSTACAFDKMLTAAKASGVRLTISSAFRTVGRQAYFWNCMQTKRCNGGSPAAPIGKSNHGQGIALDLNSDCGKQTEIGRAFV